MTRATARRNFWPNTEPSITQIKTAFLPHIPDSPPCPSTTLHNTRSITATRDFVLKKLEQMGELDNTYIVYTADHGMAIGRHGLQGKQNLYQHTWRVPYIVKGPGIKAGTRSTGNIYLMDSLATICDLVGIKAPEYNEGTSFKPVLHGTKDTVRDTLYGV